MPKLRHENEAKCEVAEITAREHGSVQNRCHRYKDLSALVVNFGENERNSMEENKSLFVWGAFSELMAAKEKKGELFYLCKTAAAMEQIEIASSCQRPQKAVGGEITKKW